MFNMFICFAGLKNPITLMSYVTPVMTVTTAIFSLMLDPWHNLSKNKYFDNSSHIIQSCLLMLLGGALAFFMVRFYTKFFLQDNRLSFGCISPPFSANVVVCVIVPVVLFIRWSHFCLQVLTEYILVSATSAVTVTIAGIVKEAVTIVVWFDF